MSDMQLSLFPHTGSPTWDDVQKGRAVLVDRIERCNGKTCMFFRGKCTHVKGRYAFPKYRGNGKCVQHFIEWL